MAKIYKNDKGEIISRQLYWQIQNKKSGHCCFCKEKLARGNKTRCIKHLEQQRFELREKIGKAQRDPLNTIKWFRIGPKETILATDLQSSGIPGKNGYTFKLKVGKKQIGKIAEEFPAKIFYRTKKK